MRKIAGTLLTAALALSACTHAPPKATRPQAPSDMDLCHRPHTMMLGYVTVDNPHATYASPVLAEDAKELARTSAAGVGYLAPYEKIFKDCQALYPWPDTRGLQSWLKSPDSVAPSP